MSEALPACPLCAHVPARFHARADTWLDFWRCPACALIFRDPARRPTRAAEHAHYRLHDNRPEDPGYRNFLRPLFDALRPRLPAGAEGLDFGCGPGSALAAMLEEAGHPMRRWDPLFAPDPAPLQQRYAFVTASEVIEHLHAPLTTLQRLDALLAGGGLLGVLTGWPPSHWRDFAGWHYRRDPTHVAFYGPETLRWIARRLGWSVELPTRNVAIFAKPMRNG
jgi:hypothetical protein